MAEVMAYIVWPVLTTIITGVVGYVGMKLKQMIEKQGEEKIKLQAAKTCVQAVEQIYKDLHGPDKYDMCCTALTEMLVEKGVTVTELEIKMLIESAVRELNAALPAELLEEATAE